MTTTTEAMNKARAALEDSNGALCNVGGEWYDVAQAQMIDNNAALSALSSAEAQPDEEAIFAWLQRKYVQSADERQKSMGLVYMTAETHDLAKEISKFVAAPQSSQPIGQVSGAPDWWAEELERIFVAPIGSTITADMKRAANIALKVQRGETWDEATGTWKPVSGAVTDEEGHFGRIVGDVAKLVDEYGAERVRAHLPDSLLSAHQAPPDLANRVRSLAEKWHKDAIDTGFAMSEPANELFEVLESTPAQAPESATQQTDRIIQQSKAVLRLVDEYIDGVQTQHTRTKLRTGLMDLFEQQAPVSVPEGYAIVPKEPPKMGSDGDWLLEVRDEFNGATCDWSVIDRIYRAMLAAASAQAQQSEKDAELCRLRKIAFLIGSIFVHGSFKAETHNERELEKLLREQGTFFDTLAEFAAALSSEQNKGAANG